MLSIRPGVVIAGRYGLERPLAKGGMGSVWIGRNLALDVEVAVKLMAPDYVSSPEMVTRFEREAKAAAQIRHPNVVQVFDHGIDRGTPFMVMELLQGRDLKARLAGRARLTPTEAVPIVTGVARALRRAHEIGIIHRDLKPANVFLAKPDDDEEIVKVLDFGIAKVLAAGDVTKTGNLQGTPHYMSPEQARGTKDADARSDLWSLGVITYRMLTGELPISGENMIEVLVRVCTEPIAPPSEVAPDLGRVLDPFFERALCRDPVGRFQTARAFAEAFADAARTHAVVAAAGPVRIQPVTERMDALPRVQLPSVAEAQSVAWVPTSAGMAEPLPLTASRSVITEPITAKMAPEVGALTAWQSEGAGAVLPSPRSEGTVTSATAERLILPSPERTNRVVLAVIGAAALAGLFVGIGVFFWARTPADDTAPALGTAGTAASAEVVTGIFPSATLATPTVVPDAPTPPILTTTAAPASAAPAEKPPDKTARRPSEEEPSIVTPPTATARATATPSASDKRPTAGPITKPGRGSSVFEAPPKF